MASPKLVFQPIVAGDLEAISEFIGRDNPRRAAEMVEQLLGKCRFLAENPYAGIDRSELMKGMRSFPFGNYLVFYEPIDDGIKVVRIVEGHRNLSRVFGT